MRADPHPTDVMVGQQLRRQRTLLGLSQERLGALLGVTYQQIQKYERGANRVGSSRLHELAGILDVPVAYFFAAGPGAAGSPADDPGDAVGRRETLELVRAFNRIDDPRIRRRVLDLARALAGAAAAGRGGEGPGERRGAWRGEA